MWYAFQGSILNVLLRDPLERIFSFFLSLSALSRELIQHSDFLVLVPSLMRVSLKTSSIMPFPLGRYPNIVTPDADSSCLCTTRQLESKSLMSAHPPRATAGVAGFPHP
jgi:hypothetical protein